MPELPEVETVRRQLQREVNGARISAVRVLYPKAVAPLAPRAFERAVRGARIIAVRRRAKILLIALSNHRTLLVHLKMTGAILIKAMDEMPGKSTEVLFELDRVRKLFYDDTRRFGWVKVIATEDVPALFREARIGPEPLSPKFAAANLRECLSRRPLRTVKAALLDQSCVAGIGNIYANEALWRAGIRPTRRCGRLASNAVARIHAAIREVLRAAVRARGSSIDSFRDVFGRPGGFVPRHHVYGREGTPCDKKDGGTIRKTIVAGRGTHYCPVHQK